MVECAFPFQKYPVVTLAHGAGGRFTQHLIQDIFKASIPSARVDHDGAVFDARGDMVFTTDSYVVNPLFFPGGDIARLAVTGTCNDLVACGAQPKLLSCGWIIEEGFSTELLHRLAQSMAAAAAEVGARVVTGDTKVVEKGAGDGVYLNVSGVGERRLVSEPANIRVGDAVIVSGDLGRHGVAILTQREELELNAPILSDCGHLWPSLSDICSKGLHVHCMRDLTRGGLATALAELASTCSLGIVVDRTLIPVSNQVRSVCELFGLDPLYLANEGRMVAFAAAEEAPGIVKALGEEAAIIGRVTDGEGVVATNEFGSGQVLDLLSGQQLPRIC